MLLFFRFLQGLGIAGLIPVAMTVISDWYEGRRRLQAMGLLSGTISLAAVVVPFTGGFLAGLDWRYPFLVYGVSLLLALLFAIFIPESGTEKQWKHLAGAVKKHFYGLAGAIKTIEVRKVFCQCLMLYFMLYAIVTFLPIHLAQKYQVFGLGTGIALSVQAITGAIFSTRSVLVNRLLPGRSKVMAGFLLLAIAVALIPVWPGKYLLGFSLVIFGIGFGILQPAVYNEAASAGPEELRGSVLCLFNTVKFIGMTLAPVLLRLIQRSLGLEYVFYVAGILAAIWAIKCMCAFTRTSRRFSQH